MAAPRAAVAPDHWGQAPVVGSTDQAVAFAAPEAEATVVPAGNLRRLEEASAASALVVHDILEEASAVPDSLIPAAAQSPLPGPVDLQARVRPLARFVGRGAYFALYFVPVLAGPESV